MLGTLLKKNQRLIKEDQREIIRSNVSKQFKGLIDTVNLSLSEYRIQEVIQVLIPKLKEYMNDSNVAQFLNSDAQLEYTRLLSKMSNMFQNALADLSRYFVETHDLNGERIYNGYGGIDDHQQQPNAKSLEVSFKVLTGILSSW